LRKEKVLMNSSSDEQKIATEDQVETFIRGMGDEFIRTLWICNDHMRLFFMDYNLLPFQDVLISTYFAEPENARKVQAAKDRFKKSLNEILDNISRIAEFFNAQEIIDGRQWSVLSEADIAQAVEKYIDEHCADVQFGSGPEKQQCIDDIVGYLYNHKKRELLELVYPLESYFCQRNILDADWLISICCGIGPLIIESEYDYLEERYGEDALDGDTVKTMADEVKASDPYGIPNQRYVML
jgi:hypothetical protein